MDALTVMLVCVSLMSSCESRAKSSTGATGATGATGRRKKVIEITPIKVDPQSKALAYILAQENVGQELAKLFPNLHATAVDSRERTWDWDHLDDLFPNVHAGGAGGGQLTLTPDLYLPRDLDPHDLDLDLDLDHDGGIWLSQRDLGYLSRLQDDGGAAGPGAGGDARPNEHTGRPEDDEGDDKATPGELDEEDVSLDRAAPPHPVTVHPAAPAGYIDNDRFYSRYKTNYDLLNGGRFNGNGHLAPAPAPAPAGPGGDVTDSESGDSESGDNELSDSKSNDSESGSIAASKESPSREGRVPDDDDPPDLHGPHDVPPPGVELHEPPPPPGRPHSDDDLLVRSLFDVVAPVAAVGVAPLDHRDARDATGVRARDSSRDGDTPSFESLGAVPREPSDGADHHLEEEETDTPSPVDAAAAAVEGRGAAEGERQVSSRLIHSNDIDIATLRPHNYYKLSFVFNN